jgi:hypothetical protein
MFQSFPIQKEKGKEGKRIPLLLSDRTVFGGRSPIIQAR